MKRVHLLQIVLLVACVVLVASPNVADAVLFTADGTTLFQDNFEGHAIGALAPNEGGGYGPFVAAQVGNWTTRSSPAASNQVEVTAGGGGGVGASDLPALPSQGSKFMGFVRIQSAVIPLALFDGVTRQADSSNPNGIGAGTNLHLETMLYKRGHGDGGNISFSDPSVEHTSNLLRINFTNSGTGVTNAGSGAILRPDGSPLATISEQWQKWEIDWEFGSTFTVCIDGDCSAPQNPKNQIVPNGFWIESFGPNGASSNGIGVDAVPEPSTLAIFAIGALTVLGVGRRRIFRA